MTFGQAVTVDTGSGTPELELDFEGIAKAAAYVSGSGTANLLFEYAVAENDVDADGIAIAANKLTLENGTIKVGTNNATLTHSAVAEDPGHKVEAVRPTLITSGDDTPKTSIDGLSVILTFSEAVEADTSFLNLRVNGANWPAAVVTVTGKTVEVSGFQHSSVRRTSLRYFWAGEASRTASAIGLRQSATRSPTASPTTSSTPSSSSPSPRSRRPIPTTPRRGWRPSPRAATRLPRRWQSRTGSC